MMSNSGLASYSLGKEIFSPSPHPSQQPLTITTMARKFIVNSALEARLLLRPSHQRTILFETIHKPGCSVPGRPILRSYSESPLPKISGSHDGSQYSGLDDKNLFWAKVLRGVGVGLTTIGLVRASYLTYHLKHADYQRVLPPMPPRQSGETGTKHFEDVCTNLRSNPRYMTS